MKTHGQQPAPKDKPLPAGSYDQDFKRRKRLKPQPVEFAVESYEHPTYGRGNRPYWPCTQKDPEATP
jgi:hypothetical protein